MRAILFNGQETPQKGELYIIENVEYYEDALYGPKTIVILKKIKIRAGIEKKE